MDQKTDVEKELIDNIISLLLAKDISDLKLLAGIKDARDFVKSNDLATECGNCGKASIIEKS